MRQFTPWARAAGGLLAHHGVTGLLGNTDEVDDLDDDDADWSQFLACWQQIFGTGWVTSQQACESAHDPRWASTFPAGKGGELLGAKSLGRCADSLAMGGLPAGAKGSALALTGMPEISERQLLAQLRESVELLAAPAADQERWLAEERYPVDELALQLDDAVPQWFPRLSKAGLLTEQAQAALRALLDALDFGGPARSALWTEEALYDAVEWEQVRDMAGRALMELGN
jgi:hypothetical protein